MTIAEFMETCIDSSITKTAIYSLDRGEYEWEGFGDDIPEKYLGREVSTWDISAKGCISFNIAE